MMRAYPHLRVLRRMQERGLARAVVSGWQEAQGEILAVMDGDLQHPRDADSLIDALEKSGRGYPVASRDGRGGGVASGISGGAGFRGVRHGGGVALPGTLATVRDPMSGYFALRRSVIEECTLKPEGSKFSWKCWDAGTIGLWSRSRYLY